MPFEAVDILKELSENKLDLRGLAINAPKATIEIQLTYETSAAVLTA